MLARPHSPFSYPRETMAKPPKIVAEHRKEIESIPPPPSNRIGYPKDLLDGIFEIYLTKPSIDKVIAHCRAYAGQRLEVMGFLIGDVFQWKDSQFTLVKDVVTTDLEATAISVRFDKEGFGELFGKLDELKYDYVIVGWYHSHPGLGCFLSSTDIDTQNRMFKMPYHTALVVDPIKNEIKAYKLMGKGYVEREFAVYWPGKESFDTSSEIKLL
jgi:proteasome lid subunit RPN8/RPN11